jgi:phosphate-selective porin OprO/OprP
VFVCCAAVTTTARAAEPPADTATPSPVVAPAATPLASAVAQARVRDRDRTDLRFVLGEHPSIRWGQWLRLDLRGRVQVDRRDPGDNPSDFDTFGLHRLRAGIDGELFRIFQFSVERELSEFELDQAPNTAGQGSKTPWKDVWGELNLANAFQLRGGRFKIPFGLDQLTSVSENDFVYRSQGGNFLSPARDTGVSAHGRFFGRRLTYDVGVFEQDGDNSRSSKIVGGDRTIAGRVTARPIPVKAFNIDRAEFGVNVASTEVSDDSVLPNGLRARTVMSKYTFFQPVFVKGTRTRLGLDVDWQGGPFAARAEYIRVNDERSEQGLRGDTLNPARYQSYYVSGAWVIVGGRKDRPTVPEHYLFQHGIGAIEVAARYDRLWFSSEPTGEPAFTNSRAEVILPNGNRVTTLGVNWYFNRFAKIQWNALHENLEDSGRTPFADGRQTFWSTVFRMQVVM